MLDDFIETAVETAVEVAIDIADVVIEKLRKNGYQELKYGTWDED